MLIFNETIKTATDPIGVHTEGVEQFEGYEHAFWAWRYRWEATRAGFSDPDGRALLPLVLRRTDSAASTSATRSFATGPCSRCVRAQSAIAHI